MSERYIPEEARQPEEELPEKHSSLDAVKRKVRRIATGALAFAALSGEAKAQPVEAVRQPETESVHEVTETEIQQHEQHQNKQKHGKKKAKPNVQPPKKKIDPKYYKGIPKELNAFKDHGIKKETEYAKKHKIPIIDSLKKLEDMVRRGTLVPLPDRGTGYHANKNFGAKAHPSPEHQKYLHYTHKVVVDCIEWLGRNYAQRFPNWAANQDILISSLTRDVPVQKKIGGNAADPNKSSHVKAMGFDINQGNLSKDEKAWLRQTLSALEIAGKVEATEERNGSFHVMVKLESKF